MTPEAQVSAVSTPRSHGVEIGRIEKELAAMWSGAGDSKDPSASAGVARACTLNLVVYTTPADDRDRLEDMLDEVNERHPGRTLILVADREAAQARIEAYISMRCRLLGATGKQICGEQVTIEADGPSAETAATAVAALLVPDVPVYLCWKDVPHFEDKLFDRLARMADRVVIDSAKFDHPCADLLRLAEMIGGRSPRLRVSDLNWGRLNSWRTLLASFWDVPDHRPPLAAIDRVAISYRPPAGASSEIAPAALLLAGWLASRLGFEVDGGKLRGTGDSAECRLRADGRTIAFAFARDSSAGVSDGAISSVTVSAGGGAATFAVALHDGGARLATEARVGTTRSVGRVVGHAVRSDADRLCTELAILSRDAIYEAALARVGQLVG
jgi:glucose-6-phosphate dehydrogenase assembly protein OpcA